MTTTTQSFDNSLLGTSTLNLNVRNSNVQISAIHRADFLGNTKGLAPENAPILFLHGFGSTKEDYTDIVFHREFDAYDFIAYDALGCGQTIIGSNSDQDLEKIDVLFHVDVALSVLEELNIDKFHLVGHSMGGLTALLLADIIPDRVLSFVDIEGNIAPEDCFLSRQIISYAHKDSKLFFDAFIERARTSNAYGSALYASSLKHKVQHQAVKGIFESMVELSDHGNLMEKFLSLPFPKCFMYGDQNKALTYLPHIEKHGVHLAEIENCGHFPMYSNPIQMWQSIHAIHLLASN